MMFVRCRFLDEDNEQGITEHVYNANDDSAIGEIALASNGNKVVITEINVSLKSIKESKSRIEGVLKEFHAESINLAGIENTDNLDLIVIKQLPVITEQLVVIGEEIDKEIAYALSLPCTQETVKELKKMRAKLNEGSKYWESQRKDVEKAIFTPYEEQFKKPYKQYISDKYKMANEKLKKRIDEVDGANKAERVGEVKAYLTEYALSKHIDFITWEQAGIKVGLSESMKSLKEQAKAFIDKVESDLQLIDTQEYKEEILVEYRNSLDASKAVTTVTERRKAIESERVRQGEIESKKAVEIKAIKRVEAVTAVMSPPNVQPMANSDPIRTLVFKVKAPLSKLKALKRFLDEDGGYQYER